MQLVRPAKIHTERKWQHQSQPETQTNRTVPTQCDSFVRPKAELRNRTIPAAGSPEMDYLGDKLNSLTSEAVTGINELKRKRKKHPQQAVDRQTITKSAPESAPIERRQKPQPLSSDPYRATSSYGFDLSRTETGPLSGGIPFGGDSSSAYPNLAAPPPAGFDPSLLRSAHQTDPARQTQSASAPKEGHGFDQAERAEPDAEGSSLSLYEGDTWSKLWFQRVMILTLIRLLLFIRKMYEDYSAFRLYSALGLIGKCLITAGTLFLPTAVFTIYRVARYLQITLPQVRLSTPRAAATVPASVEKHSHKSSKDREDAQLQRALMGSPSESISLHQQPTSEPLSQSDEDELATARQSPNNLNEEFHDTQSDQQIQVVPKGSTDCALNERGAKSQEPRLESLDINKLGNLPDRQTTRVVLGASEQLLHGVLFLFWQLKRQVDVVGYLVERSCLWRRPKESEMEQLGRLRFNGDGLEWFQDFYSAFLAILVQVYSLGTFWTGDGRMRPGRIANNSSTGTLLASPLGGSAQGDSVDSSASARVLGNMLGLVTKTNAEGELLIVSEIVVSCLVVVSLLVAVRRLDDGPLTLGLSMIGWGSIFAARIIVVSLAFLNIGWQIMLPLVLCHIAAISVWIYKIAIDSHNGEADENVEQRWAQTAVEDASEQVEGIKSQTDGGERGESQSATSLWSTMEHLTLICQVVTLFAIPSLFYWPIMFNLKLHARPFKYLALIMSENFLLIAAIWYHISIASSSAQWYLLGTIGACSIVGFVFIALYIACKPSLTEYFARAHEIVNEAQKSGIYYEFCSRVFKMPDLTKHSFRRLMDQREDVVVEVVEDKESLAEVQLD